MSDIHKQDLTARKADLIWTEPLMQRTDPTDGIEGSSPPVRPAVEARLTHNIASIPGREDYVPVRLEHNEDGMTAVPLFGESNLITTMVRADGMARSPLDKGGLSMGEAVTLRLCRGA